MLRLCVQTFLYMFGNFAYRKTRGIQVDYCITKATRRGLTRVRNGGILYHRNECINSEVRASLLQYNSTITTYFELIFDICRITSEVIQTITIPVAV
jgi:hypothetical protein